MKSIYDVIIKPVVSEKASNEIALNKYTFLVNTGATKVDVRNAVEKIYNVKVDSVNTVNIKGKKVRWGRREGKKPDTKKAIVKLKEGQKIDALAG